MKVLEAYKQFSVNYLQARAYSPVTISGYWWVIKSFVEANGDLETKSIEMWHISAWVTYMQDKGNTRMTISGNMGRFRVFIEYLNLTGHCYLSKELIKPPRKPKLIPKYSTSEEVDKMIHSALSIRDKALIALMFCTAIRNTELRNLLRSDITENHLVINNGKGAKDRVVLLDQRATGYVGLYLEGRTDKSPFLFITNRGGKIAKSSLRNIIAEASLRAGVSPARPHGIRHGSATHMNNQGVNLRLIQEYMGHTDIRTTQIYTHVTLEDMQKEHKRVFNKR